MTYTRLYIHTLVHSGCHRGTFDDKGQCCQCLLWLTEDLEVLFCTASPAQRSIFEYFEADVSKMVPNLLQTGQEQKAFAHA